MGMRVEVLLRGQKVFEQSDSIALMDAGCLKVGFNPYHVSFAYLLRPGEYAKFVEKENLIEVKVDE